jgi:Fe-S cluster biosynthesis and repair protein YggX
VFVEARLILTCSRCGRTAEPAPAYRVPFPAAVKETVVGSICADCWKEWEGMEVKVINEYRLNFMEPEHRAMLQRTCLEFLGLPPA